MVFSLSGEASSPSVGAGAKAYFALNNATIGVAFTISFHLQPITPPLVISAPNDWAYDSSTGGPWSFLSQGGVWNGSETHVIATCNALLNLLKAGYGSQWSLSLLRLKHYSNSDDAYHRCSPFPTVAAVTGTFGTNPADASDPGLGNVTSIDLPTFLAPSSSNTKVGKMLLRLPAWQLNNPARRLHGVTGSTSPSGVVTAGVVALVGYLSGTATRVIGVNGGQADNIAEVDCAPNVRIARAAGIIT